MVSEWKPGDVRVATVNGERMLVLRGRGIFEGNWYTQGPVAGSRLTVSDDWLLEDRPLVVIDPEDREQIDRLEADVAARMGWTTDDRNPGVQQRRDSFAAALREFANPKPPKPEEPTGLGAVVEDADGEVYVFTDPTFKRGWTRSGTGNRVQWCEIDAEPLRVLSEGVQP